TSRPGSVSARDLLELSYGDVVRVACSVNVRQRPGPSKRFVFLTLDDEIGLANVIVTPPLFTRQRLVFVAEPFLCVEGILQMQDGVASIRATRACGLAVIFPAIPSHDFG